MALSGASAAAAPAPAHATAPAPATVAAPSQRIARRWGLALALMGAAAWAVPAALPLLAGPAQAALLIFAGALVAWTVLDWAETPVALTAVLALLAVGATTPEAFYAGLGDDFIWLLVGAFVLAAVLRATGLAERLALRLVASARTPRGLFLRLTLFIAATAFVVPSTSGRAALLLPVFLALVPALPGPRHGTALALLFVSVILLSACASLLGAGAHLVALDFLQRLGEPVPGFWGWMLLAAPFGVLSSLIAAELILRLVLTREDRRAALALPAAPRGPLSRAQRAVAAITALTVLAWATQGWHGVPAPLVAVAVALLATCRPFTGVDLKAALKQVEWNLVVFMAAALVMGQALIDSGAAQGLARALVGTLALDRLPPWAELALVAALALLSHLVVTSRTARAAVLMPAVAMPFAAAGLDPAVVVMTLAIGSGFCQTLMVSAKPVALFASAQDAPCYGPRELLRLALWLLPLLWLLLWLWAAVVWPLQGLR